MLALCRWYNKSPGFLKNFNDFYINIIQNDYNTKYIKSVQQCTSLTITGSFSMTNDIQGMKAGKHKNWFKFLKNESAVLKLIIKKLLEVLKN